MKERSSTQDVRDTNKRPRIWQTDPEMVETATLTTSYDAPASDEVPPLAKYRISHHVIMCICFIVLMMCMVFIYSL